MKKRRLTALLLSCVMLMALLPVAGAAGLDNSNTTISGGSSHSLAVDDTGAVWAWGNNTSYQLGIPGMDKVQTPTLVEGVSGVMSVAAGYDFSAALSYNGTVYTWGYSQEPLPVMVPGLTGIVAIDAGQSDLLALKTDGTVWQWTRGSMPQQVLGLERIAEISAGGGHNLALTCSGEVFAWGDNLSGQLGNGSVQSSQSPVHVKTLANIVDIAAGYAHSLALTYEGQVYAWGGNGYGELGDGATVQQTAPVAVLGLKDVTKIAAGNESSMAVTEQGKVYTWGYGEYGQLGTTGETISRTKPEVIANSNTKATVIECGVYHNMMVTDQNVLYLWGRNRDGQIGNGKNAIASTPQKVELKMATIGNYAVDATAGVDSWAAVDAGRLYNTRLVPPLLWSNFQQNITRAELAHLLVNVYEQVKGTEVSISSAKEFQDIEGHLLGNDIKKAAVLGIMSGTGDGTTASPDYPVTRQEAAKMVCSFLAKVETAKISDKLQSLAFYADAAQVAPWAVPSVYFAHQSNIMTGAGDGCFHPTNLITRQECLILTARLAQTYSWQVKA